MKGFLSNPDAVARFCNAEREVRSALHRLHSFTPVESLFRFGADPLKKSKATAGCLIRLRMAEMDTG